MMKTHFKLKLSDLRKLVTETVSELEAKKEKIECNADLDHHCDADDGEPCPSCTAEEAYWTKYYKNHDFRSKIQKDKDVDDAGRGHLLHPDDRATARSFKEATEIPADDSAALKPGETESSIAAKAALGMAKKSGVTNPEEEIQAEAQMELPSDFEQCASCGFDHEYEYVDAQKWHLANPGEDEGKSVHEVDCAVEEVDSNKEIKYGTATEAYHAYLAEIEKNFG